MKKQSSWMWILCVIGLLIILISMTTSTNYENYTVMGNEPNTGLDSSPVCALFEKRGCPHCDTLKPTWEKFKESHSGGKVKIETFEANNNPDVMSKHNIKGFPTIRMYPNGMNGEYEEFNGERTLEELHSFIDKTSGGGVFGKASMQNNNEYEIQSNIASGDIQDQEYNIEGFSDVEYFNLQTGCDSHRDKDSCNSNKECRFNLQEKKCKQIEKMIPRGALNEMGGGGEDNEIGQLDTASDM